uniref:Uncharacterized protein n=1 Tax=Sphaerodactylus townsendi TaxID=933632 RepID=A0ACB8EMM5_9SAUR
MCTPRRQYRNVYFIVLLRPQNSAPLKRNNREISGAPPILRVSLLISQAPHRTVDFFADNTDDNSTEDLNMEPEKLQTDESFCKHDRNSEVEEPANMTAEEADEMVSKCDGGVEATLEYAKMWCKYVKELLNWVDKRLNYGKLHLMTSHYMPLQQLYTMVMEHDIKTGKVAIDTAGILQEREYYKNDSILRMDKSIHYLQRLARPGESQSARVQAEKCQRHCGGNKQLEKAASLSRKQLKVTLRMFKLRHDQAERIPEGYQVLTEFCKPYKVGEKYLEFIQKMPKKELLVEEYTFKEFVPSGPR